jgi:hypothetical protein
MTSAVRALTASVFVLTSAFVSACSSDDKGSSSGGGESTTSSSSGSTSSSETCETMRTCIGGACRCSGGPNVDQPCTDGGEGADACETKCRVCTAESTSTSSGGESTSGGEGDGSGDGDDFDF